MSGDKKSGRRSTGYRNLLRIAGPCVIVLGIALMAFSAMDFASSVGTEQTSKLNLAARRTLRAPTYGWARWAAMTLIAGGVVMTTIGFEVFTGRKPKDEPREPKQRKSLGQPLGGKKLSSQNRRDAGSRKT